MPRKKSTEPKTMKTIKPIKGYNQYGQFINLTNSDKYKGLYSIGMDDPVNEEETIVKSKIGLGGLTANTGGLFKRIRSYYIAYPDGMWIYALLITTNNKIIRELEKRVHTLLSDVRYKSEYLTHLRKPEWFKTTIQHIRDVFQQVADEYRDKDVYVMFPSEYEEE
jgi:hypothetical protein